LIGCTGEKILLAHGKCAFGDARRKKRTPPQDYNRWEIEEFSREEGEDPARLPLPTWKKNPLPETAEQQLKKGKSREPLTRQ